ncbi:TfoX/Sxy family DNA transformation protein [Vibrio sp. JC009]|uniref:TfoX/Sxy family DNA transformation protein n=1 Tax=Vibrio sp. JC009 TaxID=2912314 RepID=UPI0023B1F142|nr:TfoX/Sxy family DNA transformation protein [Vibrio sp. JC009]WED23002.1 TfoX/Sxy family DNA transformation protein [Vibrio sp. JC009]
MVEQSFYDYAIKFGRYQKRSMFGGMGLFLNDAMYALVIGDEVYIRGGDELDDKFIAKGCDKYRHVKRQTTATVNYYNVTDLYLNSDTELDSLIQRSIEHSIEYRCFQKSSDNMRLRDLPNMQLTLERMVKKSGIEDVEKFRELGPESAFLRVREEYGKDTDIRLLWKFAGALDGVHWKLLSETRKKELLDACELM